MAHMIETMAYAGEVPWHGLGTKVLPTLTPDEMLIAAGLNWTVEKEALQTASGIIIPNKYAIVRKEDKTPLSICAEQYKPVQNADAMSFFDRFVKAGRMDMETAGSLDNGKRIWGLARMKSTDFALANDDVVEGYLLLTNTHVPGHAMTAMFTPIRVVCHNTLTYALEGASTSKGVFRMPHSTEFTPKVQELAIAALGLSTEKMKSFRETAEFLRSRRTTKDSIKEYFVNLFQPNEEEELLPEQYNRAVTKLLEVENTQPGSNMAGGTWWNTFNAVTYYLDHLHGNTQNVRVRSAWFGHGAGVKHRALNLALDMAKTARKAA